MNFREWLPITKRNRVALGLALLSLVMFVTWNCMPHYEFAGDTDPEGIVASSLWPEEILSPDLYAQTFRDPDIDGFIAVAACTALTLNAIVTLALIPLWIILHASPFVRVPLAALNLMGSAALVWLMFTNASDGPPTFWYAILLLMAGSMLTLSAALFVFKNELALREERGRPQAG